MISIKLKNTGLAIDIEIPYISISSIQYFDFQRGKVTRAIGGALISYTDGQKKEYKASLRFINNELKNQIQDISNNQTELEITLYDSNNEIDLVVYDGIVKASGINEDNNTNLSTMTIDMLEQ